MIPNYARELNKRGIEFLDEIFYHEYTNNWDDRLFRNNIIKLLKPNMILLDVGAGAGLVKEMNFRGIFKEVHGIDPDERVLTNHNLDKAYVSYGDSMPFFEDEQFDIIISDNVLEHVQRKEEFFREINRVLKKVDYSSQKLQIEIIMCHFWRG
jgi:ubiquinone/menaquinone biosynthesis C-methylase UbiE